LAQLIDWVRDARARTLALIADLDDDQMLGPRLDIVNPLLWEIGHVTWFQEKWVLRREPDVPSIRPDADALYDSAAIAHDTRWRLPLPDREQTLGYLSAVRDRVIERLRRPEADADDVYFTMLSVFHEDMHTEAFTYTRQTLGYPAPRFGISRPLTGLGSPKPRNDVEFTGGAFDLGAAPGEPFVFDNEKWAHRVELAPFAISSTAVTQAEFAEFVDAGGYQDCRLWSDAGWHWRMEAEAAHPVYWRREGPGRWLRRDFDRWVALEPDRPVIHVNWHEADAFCRWAGCRLPTEAEWEAATSDGAGSGKRRFPWGDDFPTASRANLEWQAMGCVNVDDLPAGDSAGGCRQMIGNVWEWTASDFVPYPGFVADPYREYSEPWFGTHKVLRGGCWATRARLLRNTWRNFYRPQRRDVFAGFRTCAIRP
jgi:iron(II)-dependent oxidoreductase